MPVVNSVIKQFTQISQNSTNRLSEIEDGLGKRRAAWSPLWWPLVRNFSVQTFGRLCTQTYLLLWVSKMITIFVIILYWLLLGKIAFKILNRILPNLTTCEENFLHRRCFAAFILFYFLTRCWWLLFFCFVLTICLQPIYAPKTSSGYYAVSSLIQLLNNSTWQ